MARRQSSSRGGNVAEPDLGEMSRLLRRNLDAYLLNNIMRMRELLRYGTAGFRRVFQHVPYLLQVNRADLPGFVPGGDTARGIYGFERSGFARLFSEGANTTRRLAVAQPGLLSLMLIGSVGSVGHTASSDLDYWVLVDRSRLGGHRVALLEKKLELITRWAEKTHKTEVHFFLMDPTDILNNRIGSLDEDSSGDVMPSLLKEEFYRTLLHVAGKMPLWWALPPDLDAAGYQRIRDSLDQLPGSAFNALDVLDLGFADLPPPLEYLGAAMWQAHKSERDPFKAVLKMVLILELVTGGRSPNLLCNQVKRLVFSAGLDDLPIDPYAVTIRQVVDYASVHLLDQMDLIRISALFKLLAPWDRPYRRGGEDSKSKLIDRLITESGWSEQRVQSLLDFPHWPDRMKLGLGEEIKALLLELYSRIASRLRFDYPDQVRVMDVNLTQLNAAILARYAYQSNKVEDLPSFFHVKALPHDLNMAWEDDRWRVKDSLKLDGDFIYEARSAARVAGWLVHNRVWRPELKIRIKSWDSPMKRTAFLALLPLLADAFPPISLSSSQVRSLLPRLEGTRVLVVNLEVPEREHRIVTAELLARTSLGEMVHEVLDIDRNRDEFEKYLALAHLLLSMEDARLRHIRVFVSPGDHEDMIRGNLKIALDQVRHRGKREGAESAPRRSRSRLDTD